MGQRVTGFTISRGDGAPVQNGLGECKVFATYDLAVWSMCNMAENGQDVRGYTVRPIGFVQW